MAETDGQVLEQLGFGDSFKEELVGMMESAQILKDFSRAEIEILAGYAGAYQANRGVRIFREGTKADFLCLIVEGRVDILKDGDKKITTIRAGRTMGEMSVIDGFPHSAAALAVEDTRLVLITRSHFERFTEEQPAVAVKFIWSLARLMSLRLRQTTGVLCDYLDDAG